MKRGAWRERSRTGTCGGPCCSTVRTRKRWANCRAGQPLVVGESATVARDPAASGAARHLARPGGGRPGPATGSRDQPRTLAAHLAVFAAPGRGGNRLRRGCLQEQLDRAAGPARGRLRAGAGCACRRGACGGRQFRHGGDPSRAPAAGREARRHRVLLVAHVRGQLQPDPVLRRAAGVRGLRARDLEHVARRAGARASSGRSARAGCRAA